MFDRVTKRDLLKKRLEEMSVLLECVPDEFLHRLTLDCFYSMAETLEELRMLSELFPEMKRGMFDDQNASFGTLVALSESGLELKVYYRRGLLNEKVSISGPDLGLLKPAEVASDQ